MFTSRSNKALVIYLFLTITLTYPLYLLLQAENIDIIHIENLQLLILIIGAIYTASLAIRRPKERLFWTWATLWWILLIGRSINWGRIYFPGYPREYYRMIGISIGLLILIPLFIQKNRQKLFLMIKAHGFPYKVLLMLTLIYLSIDQVEQNRYFFRLLDQKLNITDTNLFEEVIEIFFVAGLFEFLFFFKKTPPENKINKANLAL